MNKENVPPTWSLEGKSDIALLYIAQRRAYKNAQRSGFVVKLRRFFGGNSKADAAKYYADWYALAAIDELINREVPGDD